MLATGVTGPAPPHPTSRRHPMACKDCQTIRRPENGPGTLFLAPFLTHTYQTLQKRLSEKGLLVDAPAPGVLGVPVSEEGIRALGEMLTKLMNEAEVEGCRAVFLPRGEAFGIAQLMETQPLSTLLSRLSSDWLMDMIDEERLSFHFQPIVPINNPDEPFAYEALIRGSMKDGTVVYPDRLFAQARASELTFHLDRAARINAIRQAMGHGLTTAVFINFNPTTIYEPSFCLQTTVKEAEKVGADPNQFVFEVVESEHVGDVPHLLRIINYYRDCGFRVALDDLGAGYASLNLLAKLKPDFVKFDRELVSGIHEDSFKQKVLGKLVEMAQDLGIQTIAEGVELVEEWRWLQETGVHFVQGYLFARPATPPPAPVVPG